MYNMTPSSERLTEKIVPCLNIIFFLSLSYFIFLINNVSILMTGTKFKQGTRCMTKIRNGDFLRYGITETIIYKQPKRMLIHENNLHLSYKTA
jgi:hypothetical protein